MAVLTSNIAKVFENVPGIFAVTDACIDCDLCRQTAPQCFRRHLVGNAGYSFVYRQPKNDQERKLCQTALEACPVEAILCGEDF